jgi:DNA-binding NarL/FixJ family response regulator
VLLVENTMSLPTPPEPLSATTRVFIVDDHRLMHVGLRSLLADESDFEICGGAESAAEALALIPEAKPDIAVLDISIKGDIDGITLAGMLTEQYPGIALLILSMHEDAAYAQRAMDAGASGYLNKCDAPELLVKALRGLLAGELFYSPTTCFSNDVKLRVGVAGWRFSRPKGCDPEKPLGTRFNERVLGRLG